MHNWGELDNQGRDICCRVEDAAYYIGSWLCKWARLSVYQAKEKFGTVRVYCSFGWSDLHSITHPGHCYNRYGKFMYRINNLTSFLIRPLNWIVIPIQAKLYRLRYKMAIKKWPDLKEEILCCADQHEYLEGL